MKNSQLRIIGGQWRSRKIEFSDAPGLRPTSDRNRETLFNWLMPSIHGARCLDLFSGSGILSLEAISRGASHVVAIEKSKKVAKKITEQAFKLGTQQIQVINDDCLRWLKKNAIHSNESIEYTQPETKMQEPLDCIVPNNTKHQQAFQICFIDPPFYKETIEKTIALLNESNLLEPDALIYLEHETQLSTQVPANWERLKEKSSGQVYYALYQYNDTNHHVSDPQP